MEGSGSASGWWDVGRGWALAEVGLWGFGDGGGVGQHARMTEHRWTAVAVLWQRRVCRVVAGQ